MQNKDVFGFYQVGDFKTYSKLEAIEISGRVNCAVEWNYNREVFQNVNWSVEPPGSLEFWYGERARQIREKYDYLVLWYSGGADSHNILMSFVRNNIFIDEIAQFHNLEAAHGNKNTFLNQEVFATSAPKTQELIASNPTYQHTKHRLVDLTPFEVELFNRDDNRWDYFYKVNTYYSPNALCRSYFRETLPDYQRLIDQGKRVCFITGIEKPCIKQINNDWYICFEDRIDYGVSPRLQMLARDGEYDEYFYWTPDLPELPCKQAHVLRRYLENLTEQDVDGIHIKNKLLNLGLHGENSGKDIGVASIQRRHQQYHLTMPGLHRLIYPDWDPSAIVCGKPGSLAFSDRDTWMFESSAPDLGQNYYTRGLATMRQTVRKVNPDLWWEFKFDRKIAPYNGGMRRLNNMYKLGPVND